MECINLIKKDIRIYSSEKNEEICYDDLRRDIFLMASHLNKFNKVILAEENSYLWLVVFFALMHTGKKIYVFDVNVELTHFIDKINPDIIITTQNLDITIPHFSSREVYDSLSSYYEIKGHTDECEIFLYTTGTTNEAKPIKFTYPKIIGPALKQGEYLKINSEDDVVILPPFSHAYGLSALLSSVLYSSRIGIFKSPIDLLRIIKKRNVDVIFIPPIFLKVIMNSEETIKAMQSVRMIIVAGSKLDDTDYDYYKEKGVSIINIYGSTETGMCYIASSQLGEDKNKLFLSDLMEMKVEHGELLVKGENVGENGEDSKPLTDVDGWYHTGDVIEKVEDGSFRIVGRKELIFVLDNGHKIKIEHLEEKIKSLSGVTECQIILCKHNGLDTIVLVVEDERVALSVDSLNANLQYYEHIYKIKLTNKIKKVRGKKVRTKREYLINAVEEIVKSIKGEEYQSNIDNSISFFETMAFDSLNSLQFIVALEEKLKVKIDLETFDPLYNYEEMINYISELIVTENGGI